MILNKNKIYILNSRRFPLKFAVVTLTFALSLSLHAQTVVTTDTLNLNKNTPEDSIPSDSLKRNPHLSPEAVDAIIEYGCNDSMMFSMKDGEMFMYGSGMITTEATKIEADYININTNENTFYAIGMPDSTGRIRGKPVFKDGDETFEAHEMRYNFKTEKAIVNQVKTEYDKAIFTVK